MAELTITVAVTTGTQYVTGNTSSIFTFDGSQPASFTFPWVASGTLRLDQSGSSNDGHPLIFSTSNSETLGTMRAGIISSGVTYYLDGSSNESDYTNTTTFNAATTRYIEIAPASQTDFYFACWVHGIGMGGIMDMTQDTWGALKWGFHDWGDQGTFTLPITTSLAITASLDDVLSFPESGWGSDTWGYENWGESAIDVSLTGFPITASLGTLDYAASLTGWGRSTWSTNDWGDASLTVTLSSLSITGSVGEIAAFPNTGWGRDFWGEEPWGDSFDPVINLSGFAITASLGTLPYAQSEEGWGRDTWGSNQWGEDAIDIALTGLEMTGHLGPDAWGQAPWNEVIGWGGDLRLDTTQLSIEELTGIQATLSVGTLTPKYDYTLVLTTSLQMSAGLGVLNINNGADHSQGVGSLLITGSLGTLGHEMAYDLTGIEATLSLGTATANEAQLVDLTGIEANFYALGSLTIDDEAVGLSGIAITGSLGSLTITDTTIGLSGIEISGTLGSAGMSPLHYKDVDITGYTAYTDIEHSA